MKEIGALAAGLTRSIHTLALTLPLLLAACGGGSDNASAPPTSARSLGLMQLTVNGIGSSNVTAHAAPFHPGQRAAVAGLSNDTPDGLDVEQVSAATTDVGTRGAGGMRYISVVYRVRNAESCATPGTCTPYTTAGHNLTFVAANTSGNLANTAVTAVYREDGSTDGTVQALATQMLPTDGMSPSNPAGGVVLAGGQESLQVFDESEITGAFVDPGANYLFPYGYVVENVNTPASRTLPASPANNQWDGQLTFAFKVPLQASAADDPFSISFIFDVLEDSNTRVTESVEEQDADGDVTFNQLAAALGSTDLAVLGGRIAETNIGDPICSVRTAGPVSAPTAYLVNNGGAPTAASAPDNLTLPPSSTLDFGFCAPIGAGSLSPSTVVITGTESGLHQGTLSSSGNSVSFAPSTDFATGETVFYTLTKGLQSTGGTPLAQPLVGSFTAGGSVASSGAFAQLGSAIAMHTPSDSAVAVAAGDFNGDGIQDLVVAYHNYANVSILLGKGDGTFSSITDYPVTGLSGNAVATGDFNGDGKLDLAVATAAAGSTEFFVNILLGNGDGTFTSAAPVPVSNWPLAIAVGDFNGDGIADLATVGYQTLHVALGKGGGSFSAAVDYTLGTLLQSVVAGDFNGDGKLDLAVSDAFKNQVTVLPGNGDGTFPTTPLPAYAVGSGPYQLVAGDFNGDGKLDVATANYNDNDVSILLGKGDGSFAAATTAAVGESPFTLVAGDFNGDGKLDLAAGDNDDNNVSVLLGKGDGTFAGTASYADIAASFFVAADLNGDHKLDFALVTNDGRLSILLGQ